MSKFLIKCQYCGWTKTGDDISKSGVYELPKECLTCGKPKTFRCQSCGRQAKMIKIRGK